MIRGSVIEFAQRSIEEKGEEVHRILITKNVFEGYHEVMIVSRSGNLYKALVDEVADFKITNFELIQKQEINNNARS